MNANRCSMVLATSLDAMAMTIVLLLHSCNADSAERAVTSVYVCHNHGVRIFADRPCLSDSPPEQLAIAPINSSTPSPQPIDLPETPTAVPVEKPMQADTAAQVRQRKDRACQKFSDALQRVHSKLRAGYRVKEGERLRARESELSGNMRRERCH